MQLSPAHKARLAKVTRVATAGALAVSSLSVSVVAPAFGAQLSTNKTVIQDSRTSAAGTTYTISFVVPASSYSSLIDAVQVKFCAEAGAWGDTCTAPTGMTGIGGITTGNTTINNFAITGGPASLTSVTDETTAFSTPGFTAVLNVGAATLETNAIHSIVLTNLVTNPTNPGTYFTRLRTYSDTGATTPIDEGESAFAILSPVTVSGRVVETLTFSVTAVNSGATCGGSYGNATVTSSSTAVPFGNFQTGTPRMGCQTVATATNADGGYATTIREVAADGSAPEGGMCRQTASNCTTAGGGTGVSAADVIGDTGINDTPSAYDAGADYGLGYGVEGTHKDSTFTTSNTYRSLFSATAASPAPISSFADPTTAITSAVHVIFKADVSPTQTAGQYQNQIEYVTTPTF